MYSRTILDREKASRTAATLAKTNVSRTRVEHRQDNTGSSSSSSSSHRIGRGDAEASGIRRPSDSRRLERHSSSKSDRHSSPRETTSDSEDKHVRFSCKKDESPHAEDHERRMRSRGLCPEIIAGQKPPISILKDSPAHSAKGREQNGAPTEGRLRPARVSRNEPLLDAETGTSRKSRQSTTASSSRHHEPDAYGSHSVGSTNSRRTQQSQTVSSPSRHRDSNADASDSVVHSQASANQLSEKHDGPDRASKAGHHRTKPSSPHHSSRSTSSHSGDNGRTSAHLYGANERSSRTSANSRDSTPHEARATHRNGAHQRSSTNHRDHVPRRDKVESPEFVDRYHHPFDGPFDYAHDMFIEDSGADLFASVFKHEEFDQSPYVQAMRSGRWKTEK